MSFCQTRPDIDYPTRWTYKVIGEDEETLRNLIADIVGNREHSVALSNRSKQGRYTSLTVKVQVESDVERTSLFEALAKDEAVKYVL